MEWSEIKQEAVSVLERKKLSKDYGKRLKDELEEIEKQGANSYWTDNFNQQKQWEDNKNGLVLPWLLGMTQVDPVVAGTKPLWEYQPDFPDIDLDFLPLARPTIKEYATKKYVHVCNVGNWVTYKPKSALQDVARALGGDFREVLKATKDLPDEFEKLTLEDHEKFYEQLEDKDPKVRQEAHKEISRYQPFYDYRAANPDITDVAFKIVGKIRAQGTHAGGLIIADRPIDKIVPLSFMKDKTGKYNWTSQWTEGRNTQLSKFGLIKFDVLGLKTIYYIWQAGNLIKKNYGVTIDWDDMDPKSDPPRAGYEVSEDGSKKLIMLSDPLSLQMCNDLRTESVFQIESHIQQGIISRGGVKDFWDLVVYNALGRPGPIDMIPEYIARRDDPKERWKDGVDENVTKILQSTYNVIVYQEQLQAIWIELAKFTVPEAEAARKIIAKKWEDKLPKVEEQWKKGATKIIGEKEANEWWDKMVSFGRYAFNLAHSIAYSLITYRCLYLKAHYPAEWWAAVMTECHSKKLTAYMGAAKLEGVKFGPVNINSLTHEFSVNNKEVIPGLQSIKGIGEKASLKFTSVSGPFKDLDDAVEKLGKSKGVYQRLIQLGAFDDLHKNRHGLWEWYRFKYCSGTDITALRKKIKDHFMPSVEDIQAERDRRAANHKRLYPRRKIPNKILNYEPKISPSRNEVMALYEDYTDKEKLSIEKEYLGYYWSSPLCLYKIEGFTIEGSKTNGMLEVVVEKLERKQAKSGIRYYLLYVTDGVQSVPITIWADTYDGTDRRCFRAGVGIKMHVAYNEDRNNFRIADKTHIIPLEFADKEEEVLSAPVTISEGDEPLW